MYITPYIVCAYSRFACSLVRYIFNFISTFSMKDDLTKIMNDNLKITIGNTIVPISDAIVKNIVDQLIVYMRNRDIKVRNALSKAMSEIDNLPEINETKIQS